MTDREEGIPTLHLYAKDVRHIRRAAREILRQCDHYERNTALGEDDRMRFAPMFYEAIDAKDHASRAVNRYRREKRWSSK